MQNPKLVAAAALLLIATISLAQEAKLGQKQKTWMVSNFRSFDCELTPRPTAALIGAEGASFDVAGDSRIELAIESGNGGAPIVVAHAINKKGTAATNGRSTIEPCLTTNAASGSSVPV